MFPREPAWQVVVLLTRPRWPWRSIPTDKPRFLTVTNISLLPKEKEESWPVKKHQSHFFYLSVEHGMWRGLVKQHGRETHRVRVGEREKESKRRRRRSFEPRTHNRQLFPLYPSKMIGWHISDRSRCVPPTLFFFFFFFFFFFLYCARLLGTLGDPGLRWPQPPVPCWGCVRSVTDARLSPLLGPPWRSDDDDGDDSFLWMAFLMTSLRNHSGRCWTTTTFGRGGI